MASQKSWTLALIQSADSGEDRKFSSIVRPQGQKFSDDRHQRKETTAWTRLSSLSNVLSDESPHAVAGDDEGHHRC